MVIVKHQDEDSIKFGDCRHLLMAEIIQIDEIK